MAIDYTCCIYQVSAFRCGHAAERKLVRTGASCSRRSMSSSSSSAAAAAAVCAFDASRNLAEWMAFEERCSRCRSAHASREAEEARAQEENAALLAGEAAGRAARTVRCAGCRLELVGEDDVAAHRCCGAGPGLEAKAEANAKAAAAVVESADMAAAKTTTTMAMAAVATTTCARCGAQLPIDDPAAIGAHVCAFRCHACLGSFALDRLEWHLCTPHPAVVVAAASTAPFLHTAPLPGSSPGRPGSACGAAAAAAGSVPSATPKAYSVRSLLARLRGATPRR